MTSLAGRRRRRRRIVAVTGVSALIVVLTVVTGLWRRSVQETRRAEARKLIALGRVELDRNPAAALAFARASLEVADSAEARMLAVQALWAGPPTFFVARLGDSQCLEAAFSPDGRRLACGGFSPDVTVLRSDGGEPIRIRDLPEKLDMRGVAFTPSGNRLLSWLEGDPSIRIFGVEGEELGILPGDATDLRVLDEDTVATIGPFELGETERAVRVWSLADRSSRLVARWQPPSGFTSSLPGLPPAAIDLQLSWLAHGDDTAVHLFGIAGPDVGRERALGNHPARVTQSRLPTRRFPAGLGRRERRVQSVVDGGGRSPSHPRRSSPLEVLPPQLRCLRVEARVGLDGRRPGVEPRRPSGRSGPGCSGSRASLRLVRSASTARPAGLSRGGTPSSWRCGR